jgi:hypothetical protein
MGSPGSQAKCFRTCMGSLTAQGPSASCHGDAPSFAFRLTPQRRHPEVTHLVAGHLFRGSIPSLHVPLSTLHRRPCGRRCMTRSQCGWLNLHCIKLAFTTLCRFNRRTELQMIRASLTAAVVERSVNAGGPREGSSAIRFSRARSALVAEDRARTQVAYLGLAMHQPPRQAPPAP